MDSDLTLLREISELMSSSLQLNEAFDRVMHVLARHMGMELGRIVIHDVSKGQLKTQTAYGLSPEEQSRGFYAIGEGVTGQVFASGEARVVPDVRSDPDYLDRTGQLKQAAEPYSFICVPITSEGVTIGVLSISKRFPGEEALDRDRRLATIVAAMISQAIRVNWMVQHEKEVLIEELAQLRKTMHDRYQFSNIVGTSPAMMEVYRIIDQVARTRATVLLMGETGTGKEMIAKAIHYNSDRKDKPFIRVNCGALSGQLLESELFGHVKGAFTGAIRDNCGRFEAADGGTIFLDEVGTLDIGLQVKLLRVLQEREFERVGDHRTVSTDVRIIAAANVDLEEEIRNRRFREDLYYRLNVVSIHLPPLRERREDIPRLIDHFLDKCNAENGRNLRKLSRDVLNLMLRYPWPGNVRELENVIERAVVLSRDEQFTEDLLPLSIRTFGEQGAAGFRGETIEELLERAVTQAIDSERPESESIWDAVSSRLERTLIREALGRCDNVKIKAADFLGINRNTLNKKYHELGLEGYVPPPREGAEAAGEPKVYDPSEVLRTRRRG